MTGTDSVDVRRRVLVVDDDDAARSIAARFLRDAGFDVVIAENGKQALALAAERVPDAVVLDLVMPGMSGLDVIKQLRADPRTAKLPILCVSALGPIVKEDVLARGANACLAKPYNQGQLLIEVERLFS